MGARRIGGAVAGAGIVIAAAIAGFLVYFFHCPCERTPGGWLLGDVAEQPVEDWTFANQEALCQIQVYLGGVYPHAINLNCMASDGDRYLSCASCDGKAWSTAALAHPEVRLRVGETVYPVTVRRVQDPEELDEAWRARARKTARGDGEQRQDGWWSFQVVSR
jgi:hypothetical protein